MAWANSMIAVAGTILGFATSAVVAEVRHAERATAPAVISAPQSPTMVQGKAPMRLRSVAVVASRIGAGEAPKLPPRLALAAGPSGPGEGLAR